MSDNGVLHLFRLTLRGYLRQQRFYAERIIMSHFRFPQMARGHTNYSRLNGALHLGSILGVGLGLFALLAWLPELEGMQLTAAGPLTVPAPEEYVVSKSLWQRWVAAGLLAVSAPVYLLLPFPTLRELRRQGEGGKFVAQAYVTLLLVDIAWLTGAAMVTMRSLGGFINGNRKSGAASAAADQ